MRRVVTATLLIAAVTACGNERDQAVVAGTDLDAVSARLDAVDAAVAEWRSATTIQDAQRSAEVARNLITGPDTFGSGDLDGDGDVGGESELGLLPASDGTLGLASSIATCRAVDRDVMGGDWDDPAARWELLGRTIAAWSPDDNTYPSLPSHPQRVVGWADNTLALAAEPDSLGDATEFAGHALLHVRVSQRALGDCNVDE